MDGVCICRRFASSALEIFAAYEAAIYVEVHSRYRTYFLKVEVEKGPIDL